MASHPARISFVSPHLSVVTDDDDVRVLRQAGLVELLVQPLQEQVLQQEWRGAGGGEMGEANFQGRETDIPEGSRAPRVLYLILPFSSGGFESWFRRNPRHFGVGLRVPLGRIFLCDLCGNLGSSPPHIDSMRHGSIAFGAFRGHRLWSAPSSTPHYLVHRKKRRYNRQPWTRGNGGSTKVGLSNELPPSVRMQATVIDSTVYQTW